MSTDLLKKINPVHQYFLNDILKEDIIPGIGSYTTLYNLVSDPIPSKEGEVVDKKHKRTLCIETTKERIRSTHTGNPWGKIKGKIQVQGKDIIKFLKLNGMV